jgi:hypothetical protein
VCDQLASLISSAENTRPEPAGTATVAAADVSAGIHCQTDLLSFSEIGANMTKRAIQVKLKFRRNFHSAGDACLLFVAALHKFG